MLSKEHRDDLRREQRAVVRHSIGATVFCALALWIGRSHLPALWVFPTDAADRLSFAASLCFFVLLWPLAGVLLVSIGRFLSGADIRGSAYGPPSRAIAVKLAFLQNTVEQAGLAVGIYLILATRMSGADLALLATAALLFSIGRAAFLAGYATGSRGRSFGMATTMLPTLYLYGYGLALMVR